MIPPTGVFILTAQPGATVQCLVTRLASCYLVFSSQVVGWVESPWCSVGGVMRTVEQPGVLSYSMSATVMNTPVLLSLHGIRQLYGGESSTLASTLLMCSHL